MTEKATGVFQLSVRLPQDVHLAIKEEAVRQRRSFNAQLLTYLDMVVPTKIAAGREHAEQRFTSPKRLPSGRTWHP